ncbi:MAG: HNH endonuclease [Candidatus Heimdallarchaeota archaeon]|nr:HNH endonuclease [Candidatus Heimdallarchaeota archaeon]
MNIVKKPKIDAKKERIKHKLRLETKRFKDYISDSIDEWGERYKEKGKKQHKKICDIEEQLLKAIPHLTESETDDIIKVKDIWSHHENVQSISGLTGFGTRFVVGTNQKEFIISIINNENQDFKQIAGIFQGHELTFEGLPNILEKCYQRFYRACRFGTIWQKRKDEIIMQRKHRCELCKTNKNLEVHHKKEWYNNEDEDLEVLCSECHMTIRHGGFHVRRSKKRKKE